MMIDAPHELQIEKLLARLNNVHNEFIAELIKEKFKTSEISIILTTATATFLSSTIANILVTAVAKENYTCFIKDVESMFKNNLEICLKILEDKKKN